MQTKKKLLLGFMRANGKVVFGAFAFGLLSIVATLLIPVFLGKYYQIALHRHSARGKMFDVLFGHIEGVRMFFLVFAILILLKFLFDFLMKFYLGLTGEKLSRDVREQLFSRQLRARMEAHQKKETGLYLLRYTGDLSAIQHYLTKGIITFVNDCLHLVLAVVVLALLNVNLTLLVLAAYPFLFAIILYLNRKLKVLTGKRRNRRSNNLSFVTSRLGALQTIKTFNRQSIEAEKYGKGSGALYDYGVRYHQLYAFIYALLPFMLYSLLALVLWVAYDLKHGGHHKIHGHDLLTFIMTMVSVIPVLKRVLSVNFVWQAGDISFTKLLRVYNAPQEISETATDQKITSGRIVFRQVGFGFPKRPPLFADLSFDIPSNSLVLVSGRHQSGKSTLFKLINCLYQPTQGAIIIGGVNIASYDKQMLRKRIAVLSDELPLIGKTVFEAISYSRKPEKRAPALDMLKKIGYAAESDDESILDHAVFEQGKNISDRKSVV